MFRNKTKQALRDVIESHGEDGAYRIVTEALASGKLHPEDFSIREIWEATTNGASVHEAVASSAFPKITGALINAKIIAAYDAVAKIGDQLVTTVPSNMQIETIAGFTEAETPEEVGEGQDYPSSTIAEKYVTIQNKKFGRMIDVTEETIYFDKTGQILQRATRIGQKAAQYKEQLIVEGIQDINTNVYNPSGIPTALYSTGNGNLKTNNPFGEAGLEEMMKLAQLMKDDSLGKGNDDYIYIDPNNLVVVVPIDLLVETWQLANSAKVPESAENAENFWKGRFTPLSSPYVTQRSTTTWYWGNFKEDFWWTEVWPLQTIAQAPGHDDEFKKDIKARTKTRFFGNVGAVSYQHSFKSTA